MVNKRVRNAVLVCNLKNDRMISVRFQGKPFNIIVIQVSAPTSNAEEAEVEWFYEDLQDLLELTTKKDVLFIIRSWNTKLSSQEIPRETGKFVKALSASQLSGLGQIVLQLLGKSGLQLYFIYKIAGEREREREK